MDFAYLSNTDKAAKYYCAPSARKFEPYLQQIIHTAQNPLITSDQDQNKILQGLELCQHFATSGGTLR